MTAARPRTVLPQPAPSMGHAAYAASRQERLAFDPRCRDNFARYQRAQREPAVDYLPIKLDIENVSRCNFRCTMCQVSDWPKGKRAEDMRLADFQALIDAQYGLLEIKLQGMGEPLLGAPDLFAMIGYARARKIWVRTVTNASLLHLKDNDRRLIDCDPNEVQISIDGASRAVFERVRQGAVFEMVAANCKRINAYCRSLGVRRTKMWTVVQAANLHELEALVTFAAEHGFADMVFSLNLSGWGSTDWTERNARIAVEHRLTAERCHGLVAQGRERGVTVAFWNITEKYATDRCDTLCPWPFERAYVSSDMRIVPCCMIANPENYDLGDAGAFSAVWFGETMQQFRRDHITGGLPTVCRACYKSS